eukprot:gene5111-6362_t
MTLSSKQIASNLSKKSELHQYLFDPLHRDVTERSDLGHSETLKGIQKLSLDEAGSSAKFLAQSRRDKTFQKDAKYSKTDMKRNLLNNAIKTGVLFFLNQMYAVEIDYLFMGYKGQIAENENKERTEYKKENLKMKFESTKLDSKESKYSKSSMVKKLGRIIITDIFGYFGDLDEEEVIIYGKYLNTEVSTDQKAIADIVEEICLKGIEIFLHDFDLNVLAHMCTCLGYGQPGTPECEFNPLNETQMVYIIMNDSLPAKKETQKKKKIKISKTKPELKSGVKFHDVFQWYGFEELREFCKDNKIKVSGTKREVIIRILKFFSGELQEELELKEKRVQEKRDKREEKKKVYEKAVQARKMEREKSKLEKGETTKVEPKKTIQKPATTTKTTTKTTAKPVKPVEVEEEEEEEEEEVDASQGFTGNPEDAIESDEEDDESDVSDEEEEEEEEDEEVEYEKEDIPVETKPVQLSKQESKKLSSPAVGTPKKGKRPQA